MSPFDVQWDRPAENELARLWTRRVADRPAITAAAAKIDRLLAQDPINNGRALSEGLYRLSIPPLKVFCSVDQKARKVKVSNVYFVP
jgi:hypothetical protein